MSNKSTDNINEALIDKQEVSKINDTANSIISVESNQNPKMEVKMSSQEIFYLAKDFVKGKKTLIIYNQISIE